MCQNIYPRYTTTNTNTNDGKNAAVVSLRFLQPALTIATCLAEQISWLDIPVNMIANWAKHAVVGVKHNDNGYTPGKWSSIREDVDKTKTG
jgi:hypothetical protein